MNFYKFIKNSALKAFPGFKYYSLVDILQRCSWGFFAFLFAISPRHFYSCRVWILRIFGAKIGSNVKIYPSVKIFNPNNLRINDNVTIGWGVILYALGVISIGENTIISQYSHLCAGDHDYDSCDFKLIRPQISIGKNVWVAADSFLAPGINIGDYSVIGARSVVVKDVPAYSVVAGNPARVLKVRLSGKFNPTA